MLTDKEVAEISEGPREGLAAQHLEGALFQGEALSAPR
jgi:hypothetical protein